MNTNVNIKSAPSMALRGIAHTFVNTRLQPDPALARVCSRFVGASGVVGFSGVKDARKSVLIADASASASISTTEMQKEGTTNAEKMQVKGEGNAEQVQNRCKENANPMRNQCNPRTPCPPI